MNQGLGIKNKKNIFFKILTVVFIIGGLLLCFFYFNRKEEKVLVSDNKFLNSNLESKDIENTQEIVQEEKPIEIEKEKIAEKEKFEEDKKDWPDEIHYAVDFISQAPLAVWDELHEEACEEASLIMVHYYLTGKNLTKEKMEEEIQMLVKYQKEKYGEYKDSDMKQLKEIAEEYYNIENIKALNHFDVNDLKKELADGRLIIIPVAGRKLGNPNFTPPGPLYHNLVLIGYDEIREIFITNDPGTRKGQNYEYTYQTLYNAIHDFPGDKNKILEGEKRVLVF